MRFILEVVDGKLVVNNRRKKDITSDLEARGYDKLVNKKQQKVCPCKPCCMGAEYVNADRILVGPCLGVRELTF